MCMLIFPDGAVVNISPVRAGHERDSVSITASGRSPGGRNGNSTPVFLPGKSHGQRSLVCHSSRGHKKLDMTEHARMQNLRVKNITSG